MVIDELPDAINLRSAAIMTFEKNRSRLFPDHLRFGKTPWLKSRVVSAFNESQADYFSTYHAPKDPILKNELDEIQKTGFSLVLPLKGSSSLSALLFFGPKKSGRLFTQEDIHLLASFANQSGTALENAIQHESLVKSKKQLEDMFDRKVQSEKMAAIGEMTSLLAHELKNPLGIIHSSAQYLADQEQPRDITREMLHYILSEAEHLNLSINSILKLARQKAPDIKEIDLNSGIRQLIDQWQRSDAHRSQVTIDLDIRDLPPVYADFKQLSQVLLNLIRNSEDMMNDKGKIHITLRHEKNHILIRVHDNGPGIRENHIDKVFKSFFTTKDQGLGLGLTASRQIIQAHNGTIELDNHPHGGAMAFIRLPVKPLTTLPSPAFEQTLAPA